MNTTETQRRVAYIATIRREGMEYVARDESGSKRAWGAVKDCDNRTPDGLAKSLFHAEEIGNVTRLTRDTVAAEILDFSTPAEADDTKRPILAVSMQHHTELLAEAIRGLDLCRSYGCHSNPLLAHCLERILVDLRKAADELALLATLTKGGE